jgi:hypothetical protein
VLLRRGVGRQRDRLVLQGDDGAVMRIPAQWTDLREPDEYAQLGAGRAGLRAPDLLALTELVAVLRKGGPS